MTPASAESRLLPTPASWPALGAGVSLLLAASPVPGSAQIRASERGSLSQTIDGTVITVDYARPRVRGRDPIFGGLVPWGEVWTPGANWATTLEVSKDVSLDGHPVPQGKYSVWMVVHPDQWTLVLDPRSRRYHTNPPDSTADQIRYPVHPRPGPFTEALTWSFPAIRANGGVLALQWATTRVALDFRVEPSHRITIARGQVASLLGRYRFRWKDGPDTLASSVITLAHEDGRLMGRWEPAPFPELGTFLLIRIADDWFVPAVLQGGEVYDVLAEWVFEFGREGGRVTGFELRGDKDRLEAVAVRE